MRLKAIIEDPIKNYYQKVAKAESGGNPKAQNPYGSALGLYQFTNSSFNHLNQKYKLGYKPEDRTDPKKSEKLMELFTKDNENYLRPRIGRDLNDADRYMAHFLGAQGAEKFLTTYHRNPNTPISSVMNQKALDSNRSVVYNKDGSLKTVGDVYGWAAKKMNASVTQPSNTTDNRAIVVVPNLPPLETQEIQAKENLEVKQVAETVQQQEQQIVNPLQEYLNQQQIAQQQTPQLQEQEIQEPEFNLAQTYAQIDQFVEGQLFQKGGQIKPKDERYAAVTTRSTISSKKYEDKNIKETALAMNDKEAILKDNFKKAQSSLYKNRGKFGDKETQDFFDRVKKTTTPQQYQRLLDIQARIGNPSINVNTNKGLPLSNPRANYNIFTHSINIGNGSKMKDQYVKLGFDAESIEGLQTIDLVSRYLSEAAHAPQSNANVIPKWLGNDLPAYLSSESEGGKKRVVYEKKGTVENYTHSKIEPLLLNYYTGEEEFLNIPVFQKGGTFNINKLISDQKALKGKMYLDENSPEYKQWKEREKYLNPPKKDNISSGDPKIDFLYKNDWVMDVPIVGKYIKEKAKEIAGNSGGAPTVKLSDKTEEYTGNDFVTPLQNNNRPTLLDQYFSEKAILPQSKYRPSSDYLGFLPSYSVKGSFEKEYPKIKKEFQEAIKKDVFKKADYDAFIKDKKPIYATNSGEDDPGALAELLNVDLGNHKIGAAWDEEVNLPYISVSDAWDFEPTSYSTNYSGTPSERKEQEERAYIQSYLMHKAGNPFKVYDRFYFDPKTKEYLSDSDVDERRKMQMGGVIKDDMGQWKYPGEITQINSPHITMKGINYPVLGVSLETGEKKMMMPNMEYYFNKTKNVLEIPII